jgi:hypothetical protein
VIILPNWIIQQKERHQKYGSQMERKIDVTTLQQAWQDINTHKGCHKQASRQVTQ